MSRHPQKIEHAFVHVLVRLCYYVKGLEFFKQGMFGQGIEGGICLGVPSFIPSKDKANHYYSGS